MEILKVEHLVKKYGKGDSEVTAVNDVSFSVNQGEFVAIVGSSGSGKSTLLKLFMRFWDVNRGSIRIGSRDIRNINTTKLRDMESFMTQDTHLFCDSIRNNIRIARLDATDEEIENACRKAAIHDFIMTLPEGYDTPVGELGDTLSGGEKQRIFFAKISPEAELFLRFQSRYAQLFLQNVLPSGRYHGKIKLLFQ